MTRLAGWACRVRAAGRRWRVAERGFSSAAIFILAMPLMAGAFGFGLDALRLTYAKRYAQGRLDMATQVAAGTTWTSPQGQLLLGSPTDGTGGVNVPSNTAVQAAYQSYAQNTAAVRSSSGGGAFFSCPVALVTGGAPANLAEPAGYCGGQASVIGTPAPLSPGMGFFCFEPGKWTEANRQAYGVRYAVTESVPTAFLRILGTPQMVFTVESESLLRLRTC